MQQWGKSIDAAWFSAVSHETGETYWYTVREGLRPSSLRSERFCLLSVISIATILACFVRVFTTVVFLLSIKGESFIVCVTQVHCISEKKNWHSSFMQVLDHDFNCRCFMVLFTDQYLTESLSKPTWKHFIWQKMKWKDGYESIRWFSEWFSSILV